jgi:putative tributyrin esterase
VAILDVQFRSEAMNHDVSYTLFLPEQGDTPYPVLVQLHGLGDDNQAWLFKSMLAMQVRDYPLAVMMPNTHAGAYLNWKSGDRLQRLMYEDMIMVDITNHLKRHFAVTDGPWAIGGLSMGGYGSMRLGLKYPDRFASIWSHSSAFVIGDRIDPTMMDEGGVEDANVFVHAQRLADSTGPRPVISFDCGVDDQLIDGNRDFSTFLTGIGLEHHYAEHPGAHTWDYWNVHVREALEQHARVLHLGRLNPHFT